jgi:uncharacterized protein YpmS
MENYFNYEVIKRALANRKVRKAVNILVGLIAFLLLLWCIDIFTVPSHYRFVAPAADGQPSMYLTNHILPELHNKSQYGRPFEVVFSEQGINDVIARHIDVNSLQKAGMSDLSVSFEKDRILFVSKTTSHGFNFYPTIVLEPRTDEDGRFFLEVSKVQAGNSRIPFTSEIMKKKILESFDNLLKDSKHPGFVRALFNSGKAKPVFSVNRNRVSIEGITVKKNELTVRFMPQEN